MSEAKKPERVMPIRMESFDASKLLQYVEKAASQTKPEFIHPPMRVEDGLPIPSNARAINDESFNESVNYKSYEINLTNSINFQGLIDNNTRIPPDTHGAVGPRHLMVTLNTEVGIQDRNGIMLSRMTLDNFWRNLGNQQCFDPKIVYDSFEKRWIFVACANSRSTTSMVLVGTSQTDDPTGIWNLYSYDADPDNLLWADYPSIGFNRTWICLTVNMFPVGNTGTTRPQIWAFPKANLYNGNGAGSVWHNLSSSSYGYTQVPAITYDNTLSELYLLNEWSGNSDGKGYLRLFRITGTAGDESIEPVAYIETPNPWGSSGPKAPQLGSTALIDNGDSRMLSVVYRNGSLWCVHTVFLPAGGNATRSAIQWWEIDPEKEGRVKQRGRIDDPSGRTFYAYPSLAVNRNSDVMIGYSRFSKTQFASANYSYRIASDVANTLRADAVFKDGEASYEKTLSGSRNRWGDYSATMVDPANDTDFWTIQEYAETPADSGSDRWGTWWVQIVR